MNRMQTFQQFLATQTFQIPVLGFMLNLFLATVIAVILGRIYVKYGTSFLAIISISIYFGMVLRKIGLAQFLNVGEKVFNERTASEGSRERQIKKKWSVVL